MKGAEYSPWKMTEKWQKRWEREKVFVTHPDPSKPKFYCYEFPPFPSGSLHMGHVRNYVIGDATARFKRLMGWNVLYTQGFDSLGLPVEEAALKAGETPKRWVEHCISKMAKELLRLGLSYDHTRFISYHDPEYYRWTQWIFLKLYDAGMVYRSEMWVGWCEKCRTAVAAELIEDGLCWRCGRSVSEKKLFQWFIDVKQIAPELLDGLNKVVFPKRANAIQRNWIGRKEGYYVTIPVDESSVELEAFTTTIELLYGVTFLAVAPDNPCLLDIVKATPNESKLLQAVGRMCARPRIERLKASQLEGIFTGRFGINPLNGNRIPIYVAPFVVGEFGAGVVLGCPAHDKKDFNFAKAMNLPIIRVVNSHDSGFESADEPYVGEGVMINSECYDGKETAEAAKAIASDLTKKGCAHKGVSFSVKNWCISRQRYWSVPIPIIFCDRCGIVPVRESDLPVELPTEGVDMKSLGNPLEHHAGFVNCDCPNCGQKAFRETSTLDTFVNSSWAYLRYCNTDHKEAIFDSKAVNYWMPCDIGFGGKEQITVGNFYFRVVLNLLKKIGVTTEGDPWRQFLFHGLVIKDGRKMSKSLGNVVVPSEVIKKFGVDAVRFHTLSMAQPEKDVNWSEEEMKNRHDFLSNLWTMLNKIHSLVGNFEDNYDGREMAPTTRKQRLFLHYMQVAKEKITKSYEHFQFQRVCRNLVIFTEKIEWFWNHVHKNMSPADRGLLQMSIKELLLMMNPVVPHITEELWEQFENSKMICTSWGILKKKITIPCMT